MHLCSFMHLSNDKHWFYLIIVGVHPFFLHLIVVLHIFVLLFFVIIQFLLY